MRTYTQVKASLLKNIGVHKRLITDPVSVASGTQIVVDVSISHHLDVQVGGVIHHDGRRAVVPFRERRNADVGLRAVQNCRCCQGVTSGAAAGPLPLTGAPHVAIARHVLGYRQNHGPPSSNLHHAERAQHGLTEKRR